MSRSSENNQPTSTAETKRGLSETFTRVTRVLTNSSTDSETRSISSSIEERSGSRGRDIKFTSSGRGGAGNIRSFALNQDKKEIIEDDSSLPRGREMKVSPKVMSFGRGGIGNIRSPALEQVTEAGRGTGDRNTSRGPDAMDHKVLLSHMTREESSGVHSSGRGGAGNMVYNRTQSHSIDSTDSMEERGRQRSPSTGGRAWDRVRSKSRHTKLGMVKHSSDQTLPPLLPGSRSA